MPRERSAPGRVEGALRAEGNAPSPFQASVSDFIIGRDEETLRKFPLQMSFMTLSATE